MRLWLVRHARPVVAPGTCYGALDVPADVQANAECAARLAGVLAQDAQVWVSPLARCLQLAQALQALRPDLAAQVDPDLREIDFGSWEGQRWEAIPKACIDAWTDDFCAHRFGGTENVAEFLARIDAVRQRTARALAASPGAGREAVWLTHAGVARALDWLVREPGRLPSAAQWPREAPGFGEWVCVDL